jgi:hypothetical protein
VLVVARRSAGWGAAIGGLTGTFVTTILRSARELRLTRIDLPFLLGAVTTHRGRAKAIGYVLHFAAGLPFSMAYYVGFVVLDRSGRSSAPSRQLPPDAPAIDSQSHGNALTGAPDLVSSIALSTQRSSRHSSANDRGRQDMKGNG